MAFNTYAASLVHRPAYSAPAVQAGRGVPVSALSSNVPACIEQVVRQLGGHFERKPQSVTFNLDATPDEVRNYLGTYLPRTVHEFETIGSELLALKNVARLVPRHRPVRVLDIGSGTGGAWMGLVLALQRSLDAGRVDVVACDGNENALAVQPAFARSIAVSTGVEIGLVRHVARLGLSQADFERTLSAQLDEVEGEFDFILVSKHLSEFYQVQGIAAEPLVGSALKLLSTRLSPTGYLILLDVTQKTGEGAEFFPVQVARELSRYLQDSPQGLRPILPVPCALHARDGCQAERVCFTQRELKISITDPETGDVIQDRSKVSYRVFSHAPHAERVSASFLRNVGYYVNAQDPKRACANGVIGDHASGRDGFIPLHAVSS